MMNKAIHQFDFYGILLENVPASATQWKMNVGEGRQ